MTMANVHSFESFGSADGPGVRYVLFLKGCAMRCQFCHNPDTWSGEGGQQYSPEQLLEKAMRCSAYWKGGGGITVSGGEPLLQIDFLTEFFKLAKAEEIHTCIDTAGQPFAKEEPFFGKFRELMKYTDLLLLDIKEINEERHQLLTGRTNRNILEMARYLSEIGKPVWIRHVLVPERSDFDEDLKELRAFLDTLTNVERVDVLPYHTMGLFKWEKLGMESPLQGIRPPSEERIRNAKQILGAAR